MLVTRLSLECPTQQWYDLETCIVKRIPVHSAETDASISCNQEVAQSVEDYELPAVPL